MSSNLIYKQYFTQERKLADDDPDNLYKSIPGRQYDKVVGDFESKSESSWFETMRRHPKTVSCTTALISIGLASGLL